MLTARARTILNLIVGDYIASATPIASESLAREHGLGVSPATVRSEVAELEQEGYVTRPHPSAGTIPLDRGYREYVETVVSAGVEAVPASVHELISRTLTEAEADVDAWTSVAAGILSRLVGNVAIVTAPRSYESRVRHIEIVRLQDFLALMIVVLQQARLRTHLIKLTEPVDEAGLRRSANRLSELLGGLTWSEIEARELPLTPLEQQMASSAALMLKEEDDARYHDHYLDGLRNLLSQPEFVDLQSFHPLVEAFEDGSLAQAMLDETPGVGVVRVVIGGENRDDMLRPMSVVIARYGIPGEAAGTVGALGPVRMEYTKTMAIVGALSGLMSDLVEDVRGA